MAGAKADPTRPWNPAAWAANPSGRALRAARSPFSAAAWSTPPAAKTRFEAVFVYFLARIIKELGFLRRIRGSLRRIRRRRKRCGRQRTCSSPPWKSQQRRGIRTRPGSTGSSSLLPFFRCREASWRYPLIPGKSGCFRTSPPKAQPQILRESHKTCAQVPN